MAQRAEAVTARGTVARRASEGRVCAQVRAGTCSRLCLRLSRLPSSLPKVLRICRSYSAFICGSLSEEQNCAYSFCLKSSCCYDSSSCASSFVFMKAVDTFSAFPSRLCPFISPMALPASSALANLTKPQPLEALVLLSVMILLMQAEGNLLLKNSSNLCSVTAESRSPTQTWISWGADLDALVLVVPQAAQLSLNSLAVPGTVRLLQFWQKLKALS